MEMKGMLLCFSALLLCGLSFAGPAGNQFANTKELQDCSSITCLKDEKCQMVDNKATCLKEELTEIPFTDFPFPSTFQSTDITTTTTSTTKSTTTVPPLTAPSGPVGTCWVMGDPHYRTFDGTYYDFMGNCTYIMAKNCHVDQEHPPFEVQTKNERIGNTNSTSVDMVMISVYSTINITIVRHQTGLVIINNSLWNLPVSLFNNRVKLTQSGLSVVLETDFGLSVQYDWEQYLVVKIPENYKGRMCGMCGNFNGKKDDDLTTPSGSLAGSISVLGKSWRVLDVPGDTHCTDECTGQCESCKDEQLYDLIAAKDFCGYIANISHEQLYDCNTLIDTDILYNNCLLDYCMGKGLKNIICSSAQIYTDACQRAGKQVYNWTNVLGCPNPECMVNSHFESCGSPCPATCQNPTPTCKASYCVQACVCNEGYLWSGNKCVPKTQCGCMYVSGGEKRYLQAGESKWADNTCSKKCTCNSTDGQVICETASCPTGTECSIVKNIRDCHALSNGTCNIYGDPHYNTFDNSTYDFQGTCTYIAAEGCHLEGTKLTPFAVIVENEKWDEIQTSPNVSMAKEVIVEVYGMILVLRKNQLNQIMVNDILSNIPVSLDNGKVTVQQEGFQNVITTDFGLRVAYDMVYHVSITLPGTYQGKTCGLCGNFNGDKNDEFQLPDGKVTKDITTFGAAWKVAVPGVVCDDGCSGDVCPKCPEDKKVIFENDCSIITNTQGPFAACHSVINPESYFRDCVYDVCMVDRDLNILCHSIAAYMIQCQHFGAPVYNWRTSTFCPLKCPDNSHYEICAHSCGTSCPGLTEITNCDVQTCTEGCMCNSGFFNNGTSCIEADQCSCYENGHIYKIGESVIIDDCKESLTCLPSGEVKHESMSCKAAEVCTVKNGVLDCYPRQCVSGGSATLVGASNPECAINSHFESCGSPCPATCEDPTAPATCNVSCCVQACVCNEGYILSGTKCVPKSQCGCVYNVDGEKRYLEANQTFWADDTCQKLCTCNPQTKEVDCKATSCPFGQECKVVKDIRNCYPVSQGTCNIYGDTHYNTFDNNTYDFQGTCTYTAAQDCHLEGTKLTPFAVIVENEKWNEIQTSPNVSMAKVVIVEVYGMTLVLRRNQLHQIMINGILTNIPVNLDNGKVTVQQEGFQNVITTDFGLRVAYDMIYHVSITVPSSYLGKTCGMCGNYDGKTDEFQLPDGKVTKDMTTFGAAWKVAVPGVVCDDGCSGDVCPKCPEDKKVVFEKDCSIITNPQGPFAACHSVINPESYFRDCVYDVCMGDGNAQMLCHSIAAYMIDCQDFGVPVNNWRTSTFCPLACPANSHYEICAQSCGAPCPGLTEIISCNVQICAEGCMCNSGFYNNGTGCVKADQCGCYENGHIYKIGETVTTDDCNELLTCLPSGEVQHEKIKCKSDELCTVKNGLLGCYQKECVLDVGGNFTFFSGESLTFTSVGAFEIVKVCDDTHVYQWFRVVVQLQTCEQTGLSAFLHVFFENMVVTVTPSQEIWVNGKTTNGVERNGISVAVQEGTVIIEKGSNLTVSYSMSEEITVTVGEEISAKVCGACGEVVAKQSLSITSNNINTYMNGFKALDFAQCVNITEQLLERQ